jgi:hypothetical protein
MRYIISLIAISIHLFALDYYAKVEPISQYNIKSAVSGKVLFANKNAESKFIKDQIIVKLDDKINKLELRQTQNKINNIKDILSIQKQTLKSFNKVSSKSKFDKDKQKIVILNTKVTLNDLQTKVQSLKDIIANKNIKIKNLYIDQVFITKDDFVNPGTLLLRAYDLSQAKLVIYVNYEDMIDIKNKTILIDDKKVDVKINKIFKTTDDKHLSAYKVELVLPKVEQFSKLVKISIK